MEKTIKIGFASWQMIILAPLSLLVVGFTPLMFFYAGVVVGISWLLFVDHYFEWEIKKIKARRKLK